MSRQPVLSMVRKEIDLTRSMATSMVREIWLTIGLVLMAITTIVKGSAVAMVAVDREDKVL